MDPAAPLKRLMPVRLAIVTMSKNPMALETWLRYHHESLGVNEFHLRFEGCSDADHELLRSSPWNELVHATFDCESGHSRHLLTQMDRQSQHVRNSIAAMQLSGTATHVLHIDDDELLHCPAGIDALHGAITSSAPDISDIHMTNIEACLPSPYCADPFRAATVFQHGPAHFNSYRNGKSIGVLADAFLTMRGPHHFGSTATSGAGGTWALASDLGVILHFESATFEQWLSKWTELSVRHTDGVHAEPQILGPSPAAGILGFAAFHPL